MVCSLQMKVMPLQVASESRRLAGKVKDLCVHYYRQEMYYVLHLHVLTGFESVVGAMRQMPLYFLRFALDWWEF